MDTRDHRRLAGLDATNKKQYCVLVEAELRSDVASPSAIGIVPSSLNHDSFAHCKNSDKYVYGGSMEKVER